MSIKNEEYYKQNITVLIALANLFGFFLVAIVTATYSLIKNEDMNLMLNKVFAILLIILGLIFGLIIIIFVSQLFSTLNKLRK